VTDIAELLRTMADNIDATRPECDYSAAHKRSDDADIKTLKDAADLIRALRTVNDEVFAASIKSVRDTAELAIELREAKQEVARLLDVETGHRVAIASLTAERDEARMRMGRILNEIDCRVQHGADSNGHLESVLAMFGDGK
jgi:hypothetical protein